MRDVRELQYFQSLPLEEKITMTRQRIQGWYEYFNGDVYVSLSGGKDSRVLLDIARQDYKTLPAMFIDTGLEYPEIREFAKSFDNVDVVRPKLRFDEIIKKYGYPIIGKEVALAIDYARRGGGTGSYKMKQLNDEIMHNGKKSSFNIPQWKFLLDSDFLISDRCCYHMKKSPAKKYERVTGHKPIIATLAEESRLRQQKWVQHGCNAFDISRPVSTPMSFWTEQDVLQYIYENNLSIASVYGKVVYENGAYRTTGVDRTGCIFCCFGAHHDAEPTRFQRLKQTHPKQYNYCINGGEFVDGWWQPNQKGLGLSRVLDYIGVPYE